MTEDIFLGTIMLIFCLLNACEVTDLSMDLFKKSGSYIIFLSCYLYLLCRDMHVIVL